MKKIKIGFITNNNQVDKYTYQIAEWVKSNNRKFYFTHYISIPIEKKNYLNKKILKKILFRLIIFFENLILKYKKKHKDHLKKYNLKNIVQKEVKVQFIKKNIINEEDIKKIQNEKFDILIRSCANILNKDILKTPKYGVLSFHHGEYGKFRGSPAGFWEVFFKEKKTGFMIQIINQSLDYGKIILEGFFQTKSFFLLNQAELYEKSNFYFKKILLDLYDKRELRFIKKNIEGKIFEIPKILNQVKYVFQTLKTLVKKKIYNNYNFKLALFNTKKINSPTILKNNTKNFLADPFLVKYKNQTFCYAEEYDYFRKRGHIICINLNKKKKKKNIILKEKFHLSFPYVFKYKNKFFMCPDTSEISEIRLYECVDFPLKWKFYKTIRKNINSVDSIIFKNKNLWWLFTNIDRSNTGDFSHDLSIFYSNSGPLTDKWKSHLLNPIKINSAESRNAGIIIEKNEIIRVSQVQGFDNYGENLNFHKIKALTTSQYAEEILITKQFTKIKQSLNNADIHHFSKIGNDILVDFK